MWTISRPFSRHEQAENQCLRPIHTKVKQKRANIFFDVCCLNFDLSFIVLCYFCFRSHLAWFEQALIHSNGKRDRQRKSLWMSAR